ncbi:hypothetical protein [Flavobacterium sp.]|uniref:hypothetical protein n=1 Tax=Flavobacterium sp. TaxID=239 RepID=UPI0025EBF642|nr:hypothetical protein [Flavobacterium sp.]
MKKLVFGLIATVLFGSLSYGQEFKSLYENYKKSTEVFYSGLNDFDNNLNVDVDDLSVFKSEESFKIWLKENISKTKFKDEEEAIKKYNEQIGLMLEILKNNLDFLKQVKENNKEFLNLLQESPLYGTPLSSIIKPNNTVAFGCINDCINNAVSCGSDADATYAETLAGGFGGAVAMWFGSRAHKRALALCASTLTSCADGCQ